MKKQLLIITTTILFTLTASSQDWEEVEHNFISLQLLSVPHLSVSMDNSHLITYTSFNYGGDIQLSADGGETWEAVLNKRATNAFFDSNNEVYVLHQTKNVIYLNGFLYSSTDEGQNWNELYDVPDAVESVGFKVTEEGEIFIPEYNAIIHSADKGATWNTINAPNVPYGILKTSSGRLIITTYNSGIHYSDDDGNTWTESTGDLGNITFGFLQEHPNNGNLYVASFGGVLESTDNGASFYLKEPDPWLAMNIAEFEISKAGLFYFYGLYGVYESTDAITWTLISEGLPAGSIRDMDLSNDHLYVLLDTTIYKRAIQEGASGVFGAVDKKLAVNVYPNPAKEYITISSNKLGNESVDLELRDLTGRTLLKHTVPASSINFQSGIKLDVGHLKSGNYILWLTQNDLVGAEKVLIY